MRISVLGPGAVGCLLGGLASLAGNSVRFISRSEPPEGDGRDVRMVLPGGWRTVTGASWESKRESQLSASEEDLLLVCLGRQHTRLLKKGDFSALAGAKSTVVCNCDREEAERLGILQRGGSLCATLMSVSLSQERDVELATAAPVLVVEAGSAAETLFRGLSDFGVKTLSVKDVVPFINSLFVYQLLFLPVALCNSTMDHFLSFPEGRELAGLLLEEGLRTMERAGRRTARLPLLDPGELLARLRKTKGGAQAGRYAPDRSYPPTLTAILRGRPTESTELNKRVVEMASAAGLELTWNWRIYQKAGRAASIGFYRTPGELLSSLA